MAATDLGTAHVFGVSGTYSGLSIRSVSLSDEFANKAQTENESGNVIERRWDDPTQTITLTGVPLSTGWTMPTKGASIIYNGTKYALEKTEVKEANKAFTEITLTGITSAGITLS